MHAARGGSWDKRRAPSWRRSGPRAVVRGGARSVIVSVLLSVLAVAAGCSIAVLVARAAGVL